MNILIDGYSQLVAYLSIEEALKLKEEGTLEGKIYRVPLKDELPFVINIGDMWRAEGIPSDKPYEEKESYVVDVPYKGINRLISGATVGADLGCVKIKSVYISLEEHVSKPV